MPDILMTLIDQSPALSYKPSSHSMRPMLSEFSYGYALTQELTRPATSAGLTGAPVFPSLYAEGQSGGGWDVMIPFPVVPLFLQFKLSHYMARGTAAEWSLFGAPYFRMHLRPSRFSNQHRMLLTLEAGGSAVFYAAPLFHTTEELNEAYLSRTVILRSAFFTPSAIGNLPDPQDHHVAFNDTAAYFCSKPRTISYEFQAKAALRKFVEMAENSKTVADKHLFLRLLDRMARLIEEQHLPVGHLLPQLRDPQFREQLGIDQAASLAAYTALAYFDAQLILLGKGTLERPTIRSIIE